MCQIRAVSQGISPASLTFVSQSCSNLVKVWQCSGSAAHHYLHASSSFPPLCRKCLFCCQRHALSIRLYRSCRFCDSRGMLRRRVTTSSKSRSAYTKAGFSSVVPRHSPKGLNTLEWPHACTRARMDITHEPAHTLACWHVHAHACVHCACTPPMLCTAVHMQTAHTHRQHT